VDHVVPSSPEE